MKVLTVIITRDYVEPACLENVIRQTHPEHAWLIRGEPPVSDDPNLYVRSSKNCAHNREEARRLALASDADAFLFVDSDVVIPTTAVATFLRQPHASVQGGWYKMKQSPRWVAGRWVGDHRFHHYTTPQRSLVRTDLVGLGCCLIHRGALERVVFEHGTEKWCFDSHGTRIVLEECTAFCNRLLDLGYRPYMNGDVVCLHLDREHGEHFDPKPK